MKASEAAEVGIPVGTVVQAEKNLFGQLQRHVDDGHEYIAVNEVKLHKKHYVLRDVAIPAGATFRIKGFTRPRSFLCSGIDAVLEPITPIDPSSADAQVDLIDSGGGIYRLKPEMFTVRPPANGG